MVLLDSRLICTQFSDASTWELYFAAIITFAAWQSCSALHGDLRPDSDINILVEFEAEHIPGVFGMMRLERELFLLLGRQVDLRTPKDLSCYFRQDVLEEAEVQYAQG